MLQWTPSSKAPQEEMERVLTFEKDGKVTTTVAGMENVTWIQEGDSVKLL